MLEWIKENKDYASLYSAMVATGAFVFSIFTFLVSVIRAKKDRKVSDYRYYEQQKQYEKEISRLQEQRNEDKYDTEEKIRINEEPYFVFRNSKISTESNIEQTVLQMTFINKGRGSAYNIIPDLNCTAKRLNMTEFAIHRYDAVRDPIAMVRIPYQYLLQLSLKYLKTESIFTDSYKERRYQELIRLAQDYLEVLQIQGYRTWEDVFTEIEDFPYKLAKNLCFEKMCIPRQYHPEYVKLLLQNMLEPYYGTGKEKMRAYSFHNYQELAVYVMQEARGPRIFKREEFANRLGISSYKLDQILQDIAYDADSINVDFSYYLDATNSWRKPLVRLDADTYFCLDGRMEGYAFYEAMFQIIFARYGTVFSKYQGERLEKMVYQMFREKHFPYITGQYLPDGDLPERNCDMILEGSERVMFVEIKKCPLPGSYEQADDVDVLKTLGEGMLYAQEQILWHKLRLKDKGALVLYDKERNYLQDYTPGKKKIIAMSICMPEYDFLTDRMMTETFLESTLRVTYHAIDPSREKVLNKLNKRAANIQMVTARLFAGEKYTTRDVFFDSMFRSLQQVWTMLRMCDSLDMFLDMCDTQLVVITGAGDVYVDILSALHLHQSRSNKSLV